MALKFAKAVQSQHDEVYALMRAAFTAYVQRIDSQATSGPYPWLLGAIARGDIFVALDGTSIVGMISIVRRGDELVIDQVGVDPARQGEGIGSQLLEHLEEFARTNGVSTLSLQTAEIMDHLLRLYTRHGFVETHRALPDHGDDDYLRVHMAKQI
jgi:GNAT superfamily N-acetyltransferase